MRKATNRELFRLRLGKSGNNTSLRGIFEIFPRKKQVSPKVSVLTVPTVVCRSIFSADHENFPQDRGENAHSFDRTIMVSTPSSMNSLM
jgi:hypothetical protein